MTARQPIAGPAAWRAEELEASGDWIVALSGGAAVEIDAALRGARNLAWPDITRQDFPLPELSKTLAEAAHELDGARFWRITSVTWSVSTSLRCRPPPFTFCTVSSSSRMIAVG